MPRCRAVHPLLPGGKPDYTRYVNCSCTRQKLADKRLENLQKYSNLGPLTRLTFETLKPQGMSKIR